jgi:hypothetical protein
MSLPPALAMAAWTRLDISLRIEEAEEVFTINDPYITE